tara:strand:+ start:208 stop:606 length:399 start_codon:yes stop_codon:yes gene_type:complete
MYTQEIRDTILQQIAEGKSLREICAQDGFPDRQTVRNWNLNDAEFSARCARAREEQADTLFDEQAHIEDQVLSGDLKPDAAKVVLSSRQWRMEKLKPKSYGQKLDVNHDGRIKHVHELSDGDLANIAAGSSE